MLAVFAQRIRESSSRQSADDNQRTNHRNQPQHQEDMPDHHCRRALGGVCQGRLMPRHPLAARCGRCGQRTDVDVRNGAGENATQPDEVVDESTPARTHDVVEQCERYHWRESHENIYVQAALLHGLVDGRQEAIGLRQPTDTPPKDVPSEAECKDRPNRCTHKYGRDGDGQTLCETIGRHKGKARPQGEHTGGDEQDDSQGVHTDKKAHPFGPAAPHPGHELH
mmetsp:Transcript_51058/g.128113  ORF Transcript_51058/g.128113 Transcript_51058/m.128113 type:complete len:224 (-) Transcript_51058:360-1031(-)